MKKIFANNDPTKYAQVDDDVFETIQQMNLKFMIQNKGNCGGHFYSTTKIQLPGMAEKKCLLLHRFIWILKTGTEPSSTIDHIDINPLNNQFENLRLATVKQQNQHKGKLRTNTSGYIGVSYYHNKSGNGYRNYWVARIQRQAGKIEAKTFPFTPEGKIEAAHWRDQKAIKYYGKFCGELNFPDDHTKTA